MAEHDPYAWVDPFAERERADRAEAEIPRARYRGMDEGRREVLRQLQDVGTEQIRVAVAGAAHHIAAQVVDHANREKDPRAYLDALPQHATAQVAIDRRMDTLETLMVVEYVSQPFRYGMRTKLDERGRW